MHEPMALHTTIRNVTVAATRLHENHVKYAESNICAVLALAAAAGHLTTRI